MRAPFKLALVAIVVFTLALALAEVGLPGYSHRIHPLALRGASGLPGALWFNFGAFVLPGLCLVAAGQGLRAAAGKKGWGLRVGLTLVQLSALAFALQGVLPLDPDRLDAGASRQHALAWALWWIAFVPGALLTLFARRGAGFTAACLLVAVGVPVLAVLAPIDAWTGIEQRLGVALWLGWWLLAARRLAVHP